MVASNRLQDLLDFSYLGLGEVSDLKVEGPFSEPLFDDDNIYEPPKQLMQAINNPRYLPFFAKHILNKEPLPFQGAVLKELWTKPFPMFIATRGGGKTFLLALYAVLRALITQGSKIVIVGAAFRQSKQLFSYIADIWANSPILRDICGSGAEQGLRSEPDRLSCIIGKSIIIAIPTGSGDKIRGLRATHILADEFSSIPRSIFENVIIGFAAVSGNPVENVRVRAARKALKKAGLGSFYNDEFRKHNNQTIISGTAYYSFNHFYEYWVRYKKIIESRGDERKLVDVFPEGIPPGFDWKDYSIIRLPYDLLPDGYMDEKSVGKAKATTHTSSFRLEYSACFESDSNGYFKRSVIESCVCKDDDPVSLPSGEVYYTAMLRGNQKGRYVLGIDPASEKDNFSIVILELHPDHRRIVYVWTTNKTHYKKMLKEGITKEDDYFGFCVRKIRDLMQLFPVYAIAMDTQGGGIPIEEALHSEKHLDKNKNEQAIWPVIIEGEEQDTDDKAGLHILHRINFADAKWVVYANGSLRFDMESKVLLFPAFDTITIGLSIEEDKQLNRSSDTLEDCVLEIEDLKDELTSITHTQTEAGRDKWSTPETKEANGKKGRQRKDRYSALLMANSVGRDITASESEIVYQHAVSGAFAGTVDKNKVGGPACSGPNWYMDKMRGVTY